MSTLRRFSDILEQQTAIGWLRAASKAQRLPHGLIFAGPVGVGKATTAKTLAGLFLCHQPANDELCGECQSCRALEAGVHPDFQVVYRQLVRLEKEAAKAKELSVDVIRQFLIAPANLKPSLGHGRVFVIEEADLMSTTAQNALLKTLEEPPGATLIVLLTDQPDALLPTIRSRCQILRFTSLDPKTVCDELQKRGRDAKAAADAARFAQGSLGLALRWLQDGVIERAGQLVDHLDAIKCGRSRDELVDWLKKAAEASAEKQLERDPQASKDQATREGLVTYLRITSDELRRQLPALQDAEQIERTCAAIDAVARSEMYLDSNVNIPLVVQQFLGSLERSFLSAPGLRMGRGPI